MSRAAALRQVLGVRAGQRLYRARMPQPPKEQGMPPDADWESRYPPRLILTSKQAPFIEGWEAGKTYPLVIQAKLDRLEETMLPGGKKRCVAFLTVTEVASA